MVWNWNSPVPIRFRFGFRFGFRAGRPLYYRGEEAVPVQFPVRVSDRKVWNWNSPVPIRFRFEFRTGFWAGRPIYSRWSGTGTPQYSSGSGSGPFQFGSSSSGVTGLPRLELWNWNSCSETVPIQVPVREFQFGSSTESPAWAGTLELQLLN